MKEALLKRERINRIEYLLLQHPGGITRAELSRRLGVHKSTIGRDITAMSKDYPICENESGRLSIDKRGYLTSVFLTMFELESLHLSARLFSRVMKFPFPHAAAALRKLAEAQGRVSRALADRIKETAEEIETSAPGLSEVFLHYRTIIEQLGIAISEERPITFRHYSIRKNIEQDFTVLPLTLEPYPEGKSVHLVAWEHTSTTPSFRTLKIERIRSVSLHDPYPDLFKSIPIDCLHIRFKNAWSIWTGENEPQKVVLRFSPTVAARVKETQWHSSQELQDESDGSVTWKGRISEPKEMYPWIRGWGPDVEVLKPGWLRETHREDFIKGVELYGNMDGKATDDEG